MNYVTPMSPVNVKFLVVWLSVTIVITLYIQLCIGNDNRTAGANQIGWRWQSNGGNCTGIPQYDMGHNL